MPYMGTPPAIYAAMPPFSVPYFAPPPHDQPYYLPPPPNVPLLHLQRPLSAGPLHSQSLAGSLPVPLPPLPPAPGYAQPRAPIAPANIEVTTEEGKGERASRISQHLKNHSRNRSASPTSHRYRVAGLPFPANDPHPVMATQNINKSTNLPLVLPIPEPILHSPRPMLSPKASFSNDPIGSPGSLRTTRVEALEFMAEVVEKMEQESRATRKVSGTSVSSAELDAKELNAILDTIEEAASSSTKKTLPGPPVPSARTKPVLIGGTRLASLFEAPAKPPSAVKPNPVREQAMVRDPWVRNNRAKQPDTIMTLANIAPTTVVPLGDTSNPDLVSNTRTIQARARPQELSKVVDDVTTLVPKSATSEFVELSAVPVRSHSTNEMLPPARAGVSGLDALEKRLVKEVGTRKPGFAAIAQLKALGAATEPLVAQAIQGKRAARIEASPATAGLTTAPKPITAFQKSKKLEGLEPRVKSATQSRAATITPSLDSEAAAEVILNRKRRKSFEKETSQVANGSKNGSGAIPKEEHEALWLRRLAKGRVAAWLGDVQAVEPDPPPPSETRIFEKADMEEKMGLGAVPRSTSPKRLAAKLPTSDDVTALAEPSVLVLAAISNQAAPSRRTAEDKKPPGFVPEAQPVLSRIPSYVARPAKVGMDAPKSTAIRPVSPVSPVSPISPLAPPKSPMAPRAPLPVSPKPLPSPLLGEPDALKYGVKSARGGRGGKVTSVAAIWATKDQTHGAPQLVPALKPILARNSNGGGAAAPIPTTKPKVLSSPKISVPPLSQKPALPQSGRPSPVARTPAAVFQPTQPYPPPATASGRPDNRLMKATSVPAMLSSSVAIAGLSSTATLARPIISNPTTLPSSTSAPVIAPGLEAKRRSFQPLPPPMEEQRAKSPAAAEISFGQAKLNDLIRKYQGQS